MNQKLPITTANSWAQRLTDPARTFSSMFEVFDGVEPYEVDDAFVLTVDMPGFEREEISVAWDDGSLNVAAEHVDDVQDSQKTYHRSFRLPKEIAPDEMTARFRNGVLEVTLPIPATAETSGRRIDIEG